MNVADDDVVMADDDADRHKAHEKEEGDSAQNDDWAEVLVLLVENDESVAAGSDSTSGVLPPLPRQQWPQLTPSAYYLSEN